MDSHKMKSARGSRKISQLVSESAQPPAKVPAPSMSHCNDSQAIARLQWPSLVDEATSCSVKYARNTPRVVVEELKPTSDEDSHDHRHHSLHRNRPPSGHPSKRGSGAKDYPQNAATSRTMLARLPMTRSLIRRTFLLLVVVSTLTPHHTTSGLDSPVRIQRNKQLQQQQQQQQHQQQQQPKTSSSENPPSQAGSSDFSAVNGTRTDRVRRTNIGDPIRSSQQQQPRAGQQRDCPSNRLIQGLLPPEYAGSPATSQRPSMARAHCECISNPLGWHLTCYAGSVASSGPSGAQNFGRGPSGGSTMAPIPNQLHPAFRSSQLARQHQQQQQQQQVAANRRLRRAPVDASSHDSGDDGSTHEGFGEDLAAATSSQLTSATTRPPPVAPKQRPDQSSRAQSQLQRQHQSQQPNQNQNRQEAANYITSFSNDQDSHQEASQQRGSDASSAGGDQLAPAASSVHSQHLTFQTVPVLFGVKYLRNNMIEIDCDQSVPNYKAAMFRGFNVNEISSFTFNNCQLPTIPFSALLHRTRTAADQARPADGAPQQQQQRQPPPPQGTPDEMSGSSSASLGAHHQSQGLKPNRRQQLSGAAHQQNRRRRRRQLHDDDAPDGNKEMDDSPSSRSANQQNGGGRASAAGTGSGEPKVKSLAINLNAIVDQRTLISLLTGLDLLEELQLNYMQLNLTSFINDLQQAPSTMTTTTSTTTTTTMAPSVSSHGTTQSTPAASTASASFGLASSTVPSSSTSAEELSLAASANVDFGSARAAPTSGQMGSPPSPTMQLTSRLAPPRTTTFVAPPTTTSTTTTTTTTSTTTSTTPMPSTAATTTISPNNLRPFRRQQQQATTMATSGTSTPAPTTTTHQMRPQLASSTATGPSIGLGAPRGLMIAQATGMPPPATTVMVSTTPLTTITTSGLVQQAGSVPSVALNTVLASVAPISGGAQQEQSPATTTSTRASFQSGASTGSPGPGQRSQQDNARLISVGVGQSQSVSYTANGPTISVSSSQSSRTTRPQTGIFHLPAATTTTTIANQPPASSTLMSGGTSSSSSTTQPGNNQQLNPNRLYQSPSVWTVSNPRGGQPATTTATSQLAAGSRLSNANGQTSMPPVDLSISATSSSGPPSTPPSSSQMLGWSSATSALTTPANSPGLSAPANTPPFASGSANSGPTTTISSSSSSSSFSASSSSSSAGGSPFGFRTNGSANPTTVHHQNGQSMRTISVSQQRNRPSMTTTTTNSQQGEGGFIAAGVRLHQQQAAGGLGNQRRVQQHQSLPTGGLGRFSSFGSSTSADLNPAVALSDDQFVAHPDGPADQEGVHRGGPTLVSRSPPFGHSGRRNNGGTGRVEELDDDDESALDSAGSTTPNLERISRATRSKRAAGPSGEEFELSFGDLLPSLRTLKLESFIDLSPLVTMNAAGLTATGQRNQQTRKRTGSTVGGGGINAGNSLHRFRRHAKFENEPGETLVAEESNMAGNSLATSRRDLDERNPADERDEQPDVEPGETLWRAASGRSSSSANANGSDLDDDDDDSNGPPVLSIEPAPVSITGNSQQRSQADSGEDLAGAESQLQQRQRQFSALVLGRLFSRLNRLQVLHLTSNEIPFWPDNVLLDSRNTLLRLYLISNNIRQMGSRSLAGLSSLRSLDLSSNQLRQLDADLLHDLVDLRQLRACRNLFRKLPLKLLMRQPVAGGNSLAKLESVDFSKNKYLSEFQLDSQRTLSQQLSPLNFAPITSLNLSDCLLGDQLLTTSSGNNQNFSQANQLFFSALSELSSISLKSNKFKELLNTANLFAKNKQLRSIDLSYNQLERLNGHLFNGNGSQIQELKLSHNKIQELPEQLLFNLRKLRHLSLAHNRLTRLTSKLFLTNQLLESLDLSHNQLTTLNTHSSGQIPFGNGANLRRVSVAHNNLSAFEMDVFDVAWSFYTQLQSLDLSSNKFAGQIQMPIFYTITDEMALNLASNQIQSVGVEALMQHEQVLDRYATSLETLGPNSDELELGGGHLSSGQSRPDVGAAKQNEHSRGTPTVSIRLANNPLACDCMLEPLVSYTRRVAAASNPALIASLFQQGSHHSGSQRNSQPTAGLAADAKYSFSGQANNERGQAQNSAQQPQVLYQFKFSDLHCDKPRNLHRRLLSHISIGDLLCPIRDERLCPSECDCHYQSAFKTVIVDCNGRQLTHVPDQLGDATNFNEFEVVTAFNLTGGPVHQASNKLTITQVDKMIIRLDNNRLESFDGLARLFEVVALPGADSGQQQQHQRFGRSSGLEPSAEGSAAGSGKKKISPVALARLQQLQQQQQRQTREASIGSPSPLAATSSSNDDETTSGAESGSYHDAGVNEHYSHSGAATSNSALGADFDSPNQRDSAGSTAPALPPVSTAVLESAEEFRNKRYLQKTCELYLDHNNIETLPDEFLLALDRVRASSLQAASSQPQAALPTAMLEPPIHAKLNSLSVAADSPMSAAHSSNADPMKTSGSSLYNSLSTPDEAPVSSLFGRQPFAAEKKAALMESVQQSVRLNKLQQLQQQQQQQQHNRPNNKMKFTVSPSLAVLSLRYNNLSIMKAKTLNRLSKLIKSSNTRLYFGHNPFNCSENFVAPEIGNNSTHSHGGDYSASPEPSPIDENLLVSPMGDQLLTASDTVSGAYLEPAPDDLTPSASDESSGGGTPDSAVTAAARVQAEGPLTPADCPVGQLKTWLTRHHSHVGDLDELYCVHMPADLADKLKLAGISAAMLLNNSEPDNSSSQKARRQVSLAVPLGAESRREHDHPWTMSLNSPALMSGGGGGGGSDQPTVQFVNTSQLHKNGLSWNADQLMVSAKLIDLDLYDICPYSNIQLLDSASLGYLSAGHQRALISVAALFILLSVCLLLMLIYFGDTQTILAFVYIHLNPIYNCLHLNETHLDGEKLYDAFVSYSSADRDIVMELIEHLEQPGAHFDGQRLLADGKGTNLDKSRDVLVTEADLRPELIGSSNTATSNSQQALNTLQRRSTATPNSASAGSFQDLGNISRSSSRMMLDPASDYSIGRSQLDISSSPVLRNEPNNNNNNNNNDLQLSSNNSEQTTSGRPYRLCIHERDWLPGHLISWNIVNSVQNSRRTILILSKEFIKSVWFQVEFHTAYYQMLEDKIDRLIVIVRGELPPKHELDKNLAFLLTTKTYLTWGEKWFWERLHYALPHRAGPAPQLAVSSAVAAARNKRPQPRLKQQQRPTADSPPQTGKLSGSSAGLLSSLAAGHADPPRHQQPLLMSSIGKDCSRLLITNSSPSGNRNNSSSSAASSDSSTSSSTLAAGGTGGGTRSVSASSFLSGSSASTSHLFKQDSDQIMTTSNDLLSSPISPKPSGAIDKTTRLSIGGVGGMRSSSPLQPVASGGTNDATSRPNTTSGAITSIMLDGGQSGGPNSRMRAKKQEKLQSFVKNEISSRFNLSEL